MKKEFTAKTVEEAKALAAAEFGVSEDKISFEIIEEPKKGFLGIGAAEAKISADYNKPKSEIAADYIKGIIDGMNMTAEVTVTEHEDGAVVNIEGETTGAVIGRRGETLDAVQYLASMCANRTDKEYYRITVDCCGYREKRKAILEDLAVKISKSVIKTGRTSTLEPMNPYERRIIHSAVSEIEGVTSKSIGEEPFRRVVISSTNPAPERKYNKNNRNSSRSQSRGRYGKKDGDYRPQPKPMDLMKTSFEKDYRKPKHQDDELYQGDLYGKIDI